MKHIAPIILLILLIFPICSHADNEWYLISRHGSCSEINILERKVGDMTGVETPDDFIELMRGQGYEVKVDEPSSLKGYAVNIEVPEKNLSLMFVIKELCKEFVQR